MTDKLAGGGFCADNPRARIQVFDAAANDELTQQGGIAAGVPGIDLTRRFEVIVPSTNCWTARFEAASPGQHKAVHLAGMAMQRNARTRFES